MNKEINIAKGLDNLENAIRIQSNDGNWNYNSYLYGMTNGLILAQAFILNEEAIFLEAPKYWLEDKDEIISSWLENITFDKMELLSKYGVVLRENTDPDTPIVTYIITNIDNFMTLEEIVWDIINKEL